MSRPCLMLTPQSLQRGDRGRARVENHEAGYGCRNFISPASMPNENSTCWSLEISLTLYFCYLLKE